MSSVIGIVQARMESTRLFGKILYPLLNRPLVFVLAERLRSAQVDEWWLATTKRKEDDVTASWGEGLGWHVYRGAVEDVLSRYTAIIRERQPDWIVRITADDPFTDGHVINLMIEQARIMPAECSYLSQGRDRWAPLGYLPGVARSSRVLASEEEIPAEQAYHRTHVLSWLAAHDKCGVFAPPAMWPVRPGWRWTVDTLEDARMAAAAFERFGADWAAIQYGDMVRLMDAHPGIPLMNAGIRQKRLAEG